MSLGSEDNSLSLVLSSIVGANGRAGCRKEVGLLRPGLGGPKVIYYACYSNGICIIAFQVKVMFQFD